MGPMEIRIVLDQLDPPGGRLRVVPGSGRAHRAVAGGEIPFTGWLGLLRALYRGDRSGGSRRTAQYVARPGRSGQMWGPVMASTIRFVSTVAPALRIRGRAAEITVLSEALDWAASGRSAVVLIEGEAGVGKTRLLAEALAEARGRGMQVAVGRAEELEQTRPFGLAASAFECARSSPDPRRAAIAELLAAGGDQARGPITVTSDRGCSSAPWTRSLTWRRNWRWPGRW